MTGTDSVLVASTEQFLQACSGCWPAGQPRPRVVTRCPGRLDCMGGMADYSGTLALQMPIARGVYVAAGPREDQVVRVAALGFGASGAAACSEWPLAALYQSDGQFVTGEALARQFEHCPWGRQVAGLCLALLESGEIAHYGGGVNLVVQSDIPAGAGLASAAALQLAVATALAGLFDIEIDAHRLARICRTADPEPAGCEAGVAEHLTCLFGEADALLQIRCQPDEILGTLTLPKDVVFAAVDAGVHSPHRRRRYLDNRAASFIGRTLIEKLLGAGGDPMGGYLANISPSEYVLRLRNELPVKMRGKDFLAQFGRPAELDGIDPEAIYKVRSRTEHHIYENDRAHRFMERLARARRTGERDALVEAGELMYASHWSYSQRCGMGSIETDILANLIREAGPARGLYGAKVTGMGCGGSLAVLMSNAPGARAALEEACAKYAARTQCPPAILMGSSPGALSFGKRYLED